MLPALLLTLAAPPPAEAPAPRLLGEFVELRTDTGTLRGVIDLPPGPGPWPAVVLHAGSGPTDRDGNGPLTRTDNLKMLGRALAAEGFAVLRPDKRGVAGSRPALAREEDARLDTYSDDARAWAALLRKDGRFGKLGYVGHSEGALVGLVAAGEAKFDAFVSLCGPGRPLQDILREQLKKNLADKALAAEADAILTELAEGRAVADVPKELRVLFRPSVQPFLISAFRRDPAKLVAGVACPVLVASGTTDLQVTAEDARRLGAGNPRAKVVAVEGMNHVLKDVGGNLAGQLPSYADPSVPLHPRVAYEVGAFLKPALAGK